MRNTSTGVKPQTSIALHPPWETCFLSTMRWMVRTDLMPPWWQQKSAPTWVKIAVTLKGVEVEKLSKVCHAKVLSLKKVWVTCLTFIWHICFKRNSNLKKNVWYSHENDWIYHAAVIANVLLVHHCVGNRLLGDDFLWRELAWVPCFCLFLILSLLLRYVLC